MIYNDVRVKKYFVPNLMPPIVKSNSRKESHYEKNQNIQTTIFRWHINPAHAFYTVCTRS